MDNSKKRKLEEDTSYGPTENLTPQKLNYDSLQKIFKKSAVCVIMNVNYLYNAEEHSKISQTWTCRECWYTSNDLHINICEKCKTLKSGLGLQNSEGLNQDIIKGDDTLVQNQNWICERCTLSNNKNLLLCEAYTYASRMESLSISDKEKDQYLSSNSKNKKLTKETSKSRSYNLEEWICIFSKYFCDMFENMLKYSDESEQLSQKLINNIDCLYTVSYCKSQNILYVDETFPATLNSLYYSQPEKTKIIEWRRVCNIRLHDTDKTSGWDIFNCPLKPSDVCQGSLRNCWFMSALSVLVKNKNLVQNIVLTQKLCPEGMYQIRLCKDGEWVIVSVDDIFPCDQNGMLLYGQAVRKQLWVPLIEKAYAKMYGCYAALDGGYVGHGFAALTGAPCESIHFGSSDNIDTDFLWARLLAAREAFFSMGATSREGKVEVSIYDMRKEGLREHHIYSILDVFIMDKHRILKLRDPHGKCNDFYIDYWHFLPVTRFCGRKPKKGIFLIEFEDFLKYFSSVGICKIRNGWYERRLSGNFSLIPSHQELSCISLIIHERTEIDLMLHQNSQRDIKISKRNLSDICLAVVKVNGNSADVTNSKRIIDSFINCNEILEPGEYTIIPFTFHQWHLKLEPETNLKYVLAIHSSSKISVEPVTTYPKVLGDTIIALTLVKGCCLTFRKNLVNGECEKLMKHFNVYYLTKDFAGAAIVAENKYKNKCIQLNCEPSKEFVDFVTTRGSKNTVDFIPPQHRQVIAVCTFLKKVPSLKRYHNYSISLKSNVDELHIPEIDQADGLHLPRLIL